jgi:hypothetical protein
LGRFRWSADKREAAQLVAEDELTNDEIAARLKIGLRTLYDWKSNPLFDAEVQEIGEQAGTLILRYAVAKLARRLSFMDERYLSMKAVIAARAKEHRKVPGGKTGLLVRRLKMLGSGESATLVEEYEVDVGLLREIRELEREVARQVALVLDKVEVTASVTLPPLEEIVRALQKEKRERAHSAQAPAGLIGTGPGVQAPG